MYLDRIISSSNTVKLIIITTKYANSVVLTEWYNSLSQYFYNVFDKNPF